MCNVILYGRLPKFGCFGVQLETRSDYFFVVHDTDTQIIADLDKRLRIIISEYEANSTVVTTTGKFLVFPPKFGNLSNFGTDLQFD